MHYDLSTSRNGGDKKFSAERFLLRSSRLLSRHHVTHLHCKLSFVVVACRAGKLTALWTYCSSSVKYWSKMVMLPQIKVVR